MAKRKELRELQETLDQRESEKVVEAAKAAEETDKIRSELMAEMKAKAQASDYGRLEEENKALMDRVLELEKRLKEKRSEPEEELEKPEKEVIEDEPEEMDLGETEDNLPEDINIGDDYDDLEDESEEPEEGDEDPESVEPVVTKPAAPRGKDGKKSDKAPKSRPVMVHNPRSKRPETKPAAPKKSERPQEPLMRPKVNMGSDGGLQVSMPGVLPTEAPSLHADGPGKAYKYWSYRDRCWKLTSNVWVAQQFGADLWETIWVYYRDGQISHLLSEQECERFLP